MYIKDYNCILQNSLVKSVSIHCRKSAIGQAPFKMFSLRYYNIKVIAVMLHFDTIF